MSLVQAFLTLHEEQQRQRMEWLQWCVEQEQRAEDRELTYEREVARPLELKRLDNEMRYQEAVLKAAQDVQKFAHELEMQGRKLASEQEIKRMEVDGKLLELQTKLLANPQETRTQQAMDLIAATQQVDAVRKAADTLVLHNTDGTVRYGPNGKPLFASAQDQQDYESQLALHARLLKKITG